MCGVCVTSIGLLHYGLMFAFTFNAIRLRDVIGFCLTFADRFSVTLTANVNGIEFFFF